MRIGVLWSSKILEESGIQAGSVGGQYGTNSVNCGTGRRPDGIWVAEG